jgi:glycosyltransferase involved in cell wall biosynthesis
MSASLPAVTVVLAVRDRKKTIAECLQSLLALDYPRDLLEILVVDNGSRDGTRAIVEQFGEAVTMIDEGRPGPAAARNAGILAARGEVVALTDSDCTVDPGWLRALVAPLADHTVGIVGGLILARRPANPAELFGEFIHDHQAAIEESSAAYAITISWASRRDVLLEAGLFDATLQRSSDHEFAYRITALGYTIVFARDAVAYHRNERSMAGLFREGWQHGFYGRHVARRHREHLHRARQRRRPRASRRSRTYKLGSRLGNRVGGVWFRVRRLPEAAPSAFASGVEARVTDAAAAPPGAMGQLPTASVVVVAEAADRALRECAESALALDYPRDRLELVVVSSGDAALARSVQEELGSAVTHVHEPRRGSAAARNAGVRAARGEVVAFTDPNCNVDRSWLRGLVGGLRDPSVAIAGGPIFERGRNEAETRSRVEVRDHRFALLHARPPYAVTTSWASRRDGLLRAGLFDESLKHAPEQDLAYRLGAAGYRFVYVADAAVYQLNESRRAWRSLRLGVINGFWGVAIAHRYPTETGRQHARKLAFRSRYGRVFRFGKWVGVTMARAKPRSTAVPAAQSDVLGRSRALATKHDDAEH